MMNKPKPISVYLSMLQEENFMILLRHIMVLDQLMKILPEPTSYKYYQVFY